MLHIAIMLQSTHPTHNLMQDTNYKKDRYHIKMDINCNDIFPKQQETHIHQNIHIFISYINSRVKLQKEDDTPHTRTHTHTHTHACLYKGSHTPTHTHTHTHTRTHTNIIKNHTKYII